MALPFRMVSIIRDQMTVVEIVLAIIFFVIAGVLLFFQSGAFLSAVFCSITPTSMQQRKNEQL